MVFSMYLNYWKVYFLLSYVYIWPDVNTGLYAVRILWKSYWCGEVLHKNNKRRPYFWNTGDLDVQETHLTTVPGKADFPFRNVVLHGL